jgi:phosphoglycerate dehydrogenase-like enzyme
MTQILILLTLPEKVRMRYYEHIRTRFPGVSVNLVDHHTKVDPHIGSADVLVTFGPMMADHVLAKAANLKWIQALGTGIDGIVDQPSLRRGVLVTNMHGFHGAPVSEAALMSMLALSRDLPRSLRSQRERKWVRFPASLIRGKTVGIFGVGAIAGELAPRCKAMGMTVVGISSAKRPVAGFDRMFGRDELVAAVRDVDYLVLLTPYTTETHHIVNAAVFAAMKAGSYLVNLARGGVVDEAALIQALEQGKLAGAALDVFAKEPLPDNHPFWSMDNVIITTHQGGFFDGYPDHALPVVEDNLRKFLAGDLKSMINIVRR